MLATANRQPLAFRLRRAVLPPVVLATTALFLIGVGSTFRLYKQEVVETAGKSIDAVARSMEQERQEESRLLLELARGLASRPALRRATAGQDPKVLRSLVQPLFSEWHRHHRISQIHIYNQAGKQLLGMNDSRHEHDDISPKLLKRVRSNEKRVTGMEVGKLGNLLLASVAPVHQDGRTIGFVEIATDVRNLFNHQRIPISEDSYLLTTYRGQLSSSVPKNAQESEGIRGRSALHVVAGSQEKTPDSQLETILKRAQHTHMQAECIGGPLWMKECVGFVPVDDGSGAELGDMIVVRDVRDRMGTLVRELSVNAGVGAVLLSILIYLLSMILGRAETRIRRVSDTVLAAQSKLQQSNEALKASEQRVRLLMDSAAEGIFGLDREGRCTFANMACAQLLGYDSPEQLAGRDMHALMHHSHVDGTPLAAATCQIRKCCQHGVYGHSDHECFWKKDGSRVPVEYWARSIREGEALKGCVVTFIDISERIRQESELRKLSQAMAQAGESVIITDLDGTIEYVNPAFERLTGYRAEEAIGNNPSMLKSSAQDPAYYRQMWEMITRGEVWSGSMIDRRKDGGFYPVLMNVAPIRDRSGEITHFVALQQDITDRQELEQQLIQAQKMEAIGTLVGGIAHDFNNMLSGITGNAYMVRESSRETKTRERMEVIEKLGFRGAEMIRQLLVFARKDLVKMKRIPLGPFLEEAMTLARPIVPENIRMEIDATSEPLSIQGDATQLQQMLMNLLANARDAVDGVEKPEIRIMLECLSGDDPRLQGQKGLEGNPVAHLCICDNGEGIPAGMRDKIFEPFFTTKEVDKGTGLGLSMVFGVVQTHGGAIEVEGQEGEGTAFHICLPLMTGDEKNGAGEQRQVVRGSGQTVLIVDDELALRETMADVLESLGYRVLQAENGREGVRMYEQNREEVTLVLMDVVMPEMGGVEAAERMRAERSDLPLILITGYDRQQLLDEDTLPEGCVVMSKPVKVEELSQHLQRLLHV